MGGFEPDDKIIKRYNKVDNFGNRYRLIDLRKTGNNDERKHRPNLYYPFFFNEKTGDFRPAHLDDPVPEGYISIFPMKSETVEGRWCWEYKKACDDLDQLIPLYQKNKQQWSVFQKDCLEGRTLVTPTTAWTFKDVNSERGTELFIKMGFEKEDFLNPKPLGTIKRIISIASNPGDIILDSFAGSGTTAQAVMELNKEGGSPRRFILIEMKSYVTNVTSERAKRTIRGYSDADPIDSSFSFYELGEPLLNDGFLNESIDIELIREYIYYSETRCQYVKPVSHSSYFIGYSNGYAYYFYYEKGQETILNEDSFISFSVDSDHHVVYADICTLSKEQLLSMKITFKPNFPNSV